MKKRKKTASKKTKVLSDQSKVMLKVFLRQALHGLLNSIVLQKKILQNSTKNLFHYLLGLVI